MTRDDFTNDEHAAGRYERLRVSDDYSRVGGTWWQVADIPARSDIEEDQ